VVIIIIRFRHRGAHGCLKPAYLYGCGGFFLRRNYADFVRQLPLSGRNYWLPLSGGPIPAMKRGKFCFVEYPVQKK
jgi:hypothetical protein